jgi:hypothetical protein
MGILLKHHLFIFMRALIITGIVLMFNWGSLLAQGGDAGQTPSSETVEILDSPKAVEGTLVKVIVRSSLNFRTMGKIKEDALTALKQKAANNGHTQLWIDPEASVSARYNKRDYKVTLVAKGYR